MWIRSKHRGNFSRPVNFFLGPVGYSELGYFFGISGEALGGGRGGGAIRLVGFGVRRCRGRDEGSKFNQKPGRLRGGRELFLVEEFGGNEK